MRIAKTTSLEADDSYQLFEQNRRILHEKDEYPVNARRSKRSVRVGNRGDHPNGNAAEADVEFSPQCGEKRVDVDGRLPRISPYRLTAHRFKDALRRPWATALAVRAGTTTAARPVCTEARRAYWNTVMPVSMRCSISRVASDRPRCALTRIEVDWRPSDG